MKIKNIFKKKSSVVVKANLQPLDKKQLEKVVGGVDKGDKSDGLSAETSTVRALDGNPTI